MSKSVPTARLKRIQVVTLALLVIGGAVNYIDRATLAVANPLIRKDLGLDVSDMGWLLSAFLWAYAFGQLPGGALVDRLGARFALTLSMTLWSLGQLLGGTVANFWQFCAARVALGLGEAPNFPGCARASRDWFNPRQRGTAVGIWNSASSMGSAVSLPLLTFLMLTFSWRIMFVIMGIVGLFLAVVLYLVLRNPPEVDLTPEERAFLTEGDAPGARAKVTWADWRGLFAHKTTWGMIIGYFGCIYGMWLYTSWLPGYLEIERHFKLDKTGLVGAIPFAFGVAGAISGGRIVDALLARGVSPLRSRKIPMSLALIVGAVLTVVAAETPSDVVAIACISGAMFSIYVSSSAAWAMASVAAPVHLTASLGSLQNFGGFIGGALAPIVTGYTVKGTGHFEIALLVCAAVGVVAATGYWVLIQQPIPASEGDPAPAVASTERLKAAE